MTAIGPRLADAIAEQGIPLTAGIARLDVPLADVEAEAAEIWAERERRVAARTVHLAADRTHSPSDQIAYALDEWLVTHPKAAVTQLADYPAWAAEMAARETANRAARNARKEMS